MSGNEHVLYKAPGADDVVFSTKEDIVEDYQTHRSITTVYKDAGGNIVRQDVRIEVKEGLIAAGDSGA